MSTKIYDGCIIRNITILEFTKLINNIRIKSEEVLKQLLIKKWTSKIEHMVSDYQMLTLKQFHKKYFHTKKQKEYYSRNIFRYSEDFLKDEMKRSENSSLRIDSDLDFTFSVVFFPYEKDILCFPVYHQRKFKEVWESFKEIEEYGYWDNSDHPENISYEDFKKRGEIWEKVMNYNPKSAWLSSLNGLTAEIITSYSAECTTYTIRIDDILKDINIDNTLQDRINNYAESKTSSLIYKNLLKLRKLNNENINNNDDDEDVSDYWKLSKEVDKIFKSDKGQKLLKKYSNKLSQKIKLITKDLIVKDIRPIKNQNKV